MSDVENAETLTCGVCRKTGSFTAPVSVILVFAPGMAKPYPLIPAEDYRVCGACDAIFTFVNRAVEAHPTSRRSGRASKSRWRKSVERFEQLLSTLPEFLVIGSIERCQLGANPSGVERRFFREQHEAVVQVLLGQPSQLEQQE